MVTDEPLERLRKLCLAFPEVTERLFGGHTTPTFRVRDKIFAQFEDGHHHDGRPALWCKAPPGGQDVLVGSDPKRFFVPPYVGHNGWVGVWLDVPIDWDVIAALVTDSYRMTAPNGSPRRSTWRLESPGRTAQNVSGSESHGPPFGRAATVRAERVPARS